MIAAHTTTTGAALALRTGETTAARRPWGGAR